MTLITKTLLKEHVSPFLAGIGTIVFVFLLNIVFRDLGRLLGKGLPFWIIFQFFYLNMAWILALAVPMSVLLASLMAFGRLSADNEITALKASGIDFYRLLFPVLAAAGVLTILMIPFNNNVLPKFNHQWRNLYSDISQTRPTLTLEPDVFFNDIPQFTVLVHRIKNKKGLLEDIVINDTRDSRFDKTIVAERGQFLYLKEQGRMVMTLFNGEIHEIERGRLENYRRMLFEKHTVSIVVSDAVLKRRTEGPVGDREKTSGMMLKDIREGRHMLSQREQVILNLVNRDFYSVFPKSFSTSSQIEQKDAVIRPSYPLRLEQMIQMIRGENSVIRVHRKAIASWWVEIQKKVSIPFACLVFVLVGAPLGVKVRQSGIATAGWMSIVFYLVYWSCLIGGEELADRMYLSPVVAMWAPNVVIGLAGVLLVLQTGREVDVASWVKGILHFRKGSSA